MTLGAGVPVDDPSTCQTNRHVSNFNHDDFEKHPIDIRYLENEWIDCFLVYVHKIVVLCMDEDMSYLQ